MPFIIGNKKSFNFMGGTQRFPIFNPFIKHIKHHNILYVRRGVRGDVVPPTRKLNDFLFHKLDCILPYNIIFITHDSRITLIIKPKNPEKCLSLFHLSVSLNTVCPRILLTLLVPMLERIQPLVGFRITTQTG